MSVKIKVTVDKPANAWFGYRAETFFMKLSDNTYNGLVCMAAEKNMSLNDLFIKILTDKMNDLEKEKEDGTGPGTTD